MQPPHPQAGELSRDDRRRLDQWLRDLDERWEDGALGRIARELPASGPLRRAALGELLQADLRRRWEGGHRKKALEDYLAEFPELGTPQSAPLELIQAEFRIRRQAGDSITWADLAQRFPGQTEQLRRGLEQLWQEPSQSAAPAEAAADASAMHTLRPEESVSDRPAPPGSATAHVKASASRYHILRELGRGAMGTVYLAQDTHLHRQVALKVPHFRPGESDELVKRFLREARAAATLDHPNICPVYDAGENDGVPYLTMAFIEGQPLSKLIDPMRPMPQRRVAEIVHRLALALDEAHRHSIIHRDLKPSNIMMNRRSEPVIMDFGLARRIDHDVRLTNQGSVLGTPAYMSPEQVTGDNNNVGPRSDIYSLGVILYELLTGRVPFSGGMGQVMASILTATPTPPRELRPDVSPELERICARAMARDAGDRYPTMGEFAADLGRYLQVAATGQSPDVLRETSTPNNAFRGSTIAPPPEPPPLPRPSKWLRAAVAVALACFVIGLFVYLLVGFGGGAIDVTIDTDPPGAAVTVNGKRHDRLTKATLSLAPGTYEVRLELEKYEPRAERIVVSAGGPTAFRFPLKQSPGDVKPPPLETVEVVVRSKPAGARVSVGGKEVGTTQATVRLSVGKHTLQLTHPRCRPLEKEIAVTAGTKEPFEFSLEWLPRQVHLATKPPGARVTVDGKPHKGLTDGDFELEVGTHTLRLEKDGYKPLVVKLDVPGEGDFTAPVYALSPEPGERYALLVGVRRPCDTLPDFLHAESDVAALGRLLVAGGYRPENVRVLTARRGEADAKLYPSAARITAELQALASKCRQGDSLLVALAGHAVQRAGDPSCYFCPAGADLKDTKSLVSLAAIHRALLESRAGSRLLLVDGWRHDWVRPKVEPEGVTRARPQDLVAGGAVPVLLSCAAGAVGYEHPDARHGAFYEAVLYGLSTPKGQTPRGLADAVTARVSELVKREYGKVQTPELVGDAPGWTLLDLDGAVGHYGRGLVLMESAARHKEAKHREEDWARAAEEFGRAASAAPGLVEAHTQAAAAHYHLRDLDRSVAESRRALVIDPDNDRAHSHLGEALTQQKNFGPAEASHRKAIQLEPNYARGYNTLGQTLYLAGKTDEAIKEYSRALELNPGLKVAWRNLAVAYLALDPPNALAACAAMDKLTAMDRTAPEGWYLRGRALLLLKRPQDAVEELSEAIRLDGTFALAYFRRAEAYQALNMPQEAAADLTMFKKLVGKGK